MAASLLVAQSVPPRVVMEILGRTPDRADDEHLQPCGAGGPSEAADRMAKTLWQDDEDQADEPEAAEPEGGE